MQTPPQMNRRQVWLAAARPKTLWAGVAPVTVATAMIVAVDAFDSVRFALCLLTAMSVQIGANLANDYFDFINGADTVDRKGPLRVTQAGLVPPEQVRNAFILCFTVCGLCAVALSTWGGWPILALGAFSIIAAILYTGGPAPLGYMGLGDPLVLFFFGPVAVGGTYYIHTGELPQAVILAGLAPGLLSVALLCVNNLRDIDSDRKAGKRTLAVLLGPAGTRTEYLVCITVAAAIPAYLAATNPAHPHAWLPMLILVPAFLPVKIVFATTDGPSLNRALGMTAALLLFHSALFCLGWLM